MTRDVQAEELSDAQREHLLRAASEDERHGRIVRCVSEQELREFISRLRSASS